jgi:hypothetical protein
VFALRERQDVGHVEVSPSRPAPEGVKIWDIPDVGHVEASPVMPKVKATCAAIRQRTDRLLSTLGSP